jgi:inner membrane protein
MDSVTQILFGGVIGAAGFRTQLGRRAVIAGGAIATLPDLDVLADLVTEPSVINVWLHHRSLTHSFPLTLVAGAIIGAGIWAVERRVSRRPRILPKDALDDGGRRSAWMWLGMLSAVTHPLLDLFTSYGTQLLAPFSMARFAVHAMPIIDPLYSLPLLAVFLFALLTRRHAETAQRVAQLALVYIGLYTTLAWGVGRHMEERAREELRALHPAAAAAARVDAYPVIFQIWWRRIVADLPDEILVGFASPFRAAPIAWQRIPRSENGLGQTAALSAIQASYEARVFRWFADGRVHWRQLPQPSGGYVFEARDYRYGLPGDSVLGFWGLRFRTDAQGHITEPLVPLAERPPFSRAGLQQLRDGVLGH